MWKKVSRSWFWAENMVASNNFATIHVASHLFHFHILEHSHNSTFPHPFCVSQVLVQVYVNAPHGESGTGFLKLPGSARSVCMQLAMTPGHEPAVHLRDPSSPFAWVCGPFRRANSAWLQHAEKVYILSIATKMVPRPRFSVYIRMVENTWWPPWSIPRDRWRGNHLSCNREYASSSACSWHGQRLDVQCLGVCHHTGPWPFVLWTLLSCVRINGCVAALILQHSRSFFSFHFIHLNT